MRNNGNDSTDPSSRHHHQQRNLSRNHRFTQHPSGHNETGAFAIRGINGGSQSASDDIQDDITVLQTQPQEDRTAQPPIPPRGGGGPTTTTAPRSSTSHGPQPPQPNLPTPGDFSNNREEEPAVVVTRATVVDERAEALRTAELDELRRERQAERLHQIEMERRQVAVERNLLTEHDRVLVLEAELQRVRAVAGGEILTAPVERVVSPQNDLAHGEEEMQEDSDPMPAPSAASQTEGNQDQCDLEARPAEVLPMSVRLDDEDGTHMGTSDDGRNDDEQSDHSSHMRQTRRRCILFAAGLLVLVAVVVAVVVAVMDDGKSSTVQPFPEPVFWKQLGANLNGRAAGDWFGYSIALSADGTILAVGALQNEHGNGTDPGRVIVYRYDSAKNKWGQVGEDLIGAAAGDIFGRSIALSGDGSILAVGADGNDDNGAWSGHVRVFVYRKANNQWIPLGTDVNGEAAFDRAGWSVALSSDGMVLAVGTYQSSSIGENEGHVRVFRYGGTAMGSWILLGGKLKGETAGDQFGRSVALSDDGTILAVGGRHNDKGGNDSGRASVYRYDSTGGWSQIGPDLVGSAALDRFGESLALSSSGSILAVGAPRNDANGIDSGRVRVFAYNTASGKWDQLGRDLVGEDAGDWFGWSVALSSDGTVLAVGAKYNNGNGFNYSGHVRIFQYNKANKTWNQLGEDWNGEAPIDWFGYSVALSGDGTIVAGGAIGHDSNGENSGHVQVHQSMLAQNLHMDA